MTEPAEYVQTVQAARESDLAAAFAQSDAGDDDAYETLDQTALSVEVKRMVEITFGIGGPSDWMEAELWDDGTVRYLTYFATWGNEHYRETVQQNSALWRYAEYVVSGMDFKG